MSEITSEQILKSKGMKSTLQRKKVLDFLIQNDEQAFSIDELVANLAGNFDRVTAYRIINVFSKKGLLEKINHIDNSLKVILSPKVKHSHRHLVTCRICGDTVVANVCVQNNWQQKISNLGFKDISLSLIHI